MLKAGVTKTQGRPTSPIQSQGKQEGRGANEVSMSSGDATKWGYLKKFWG
jgi:hypothetical protein